MPKGIELSHGNFVYVTYAGTQSMPDIAYGRDRRLLLFLPLAHAFARYMVLYCFAGDVELGLSNNLKTILSDFGEFKPSFILAVPRIFEKVYNAASQKAGAGMKGRHLCQARPPHANGRTRSRRATGSRPRCGCATPCTTA